MTVTLFHNPDCRTSRNVLALIRHAGIEPEIVDSLVATPTRERLRELLADMAMPVRDPLRRKGMPSVEPGLDDATWPDDALLAVARPPDFTKEDGDVIRDDGTRRG